jgi:hypothetical protein
MFEEKAMTIVRELCASGLVIDDKPRVIFEIAEVLRSEWHDTQARNQNIPKRSTKATTQTNGLQTTRPENMPLLNNIAGRGHGFNGLCALPSKPDCLLAPIPAYTPSPDPYAQPIVLSSLPLPKWQPLEHHSDLKHLIPLELNFS